jgi:N-acetylmuramoyl-L-alanine amidase
MLAVGAVAPAAAHATSITCALAPSTVFVNQGVVVQGTVANPGAGQEVQVTLDGAPLVSATTDDTGAYRAQFTATRGGAVVAHLVADGSLSTTCILVVKPTVRLAHGVALPYSNTRFVIRVAPASYRATITVHVWHRGHIVAVVRALCRNGSATFLAPAPGIDWFTVSIALPAANGIAQRGVQARFRVAWRRVAKGSKGAYVHILLQQLARLHIRVPGIGWTLTFPGSESIVTFQKAYRLPRTYVFDYDDWLRLDIARLLRPRYGSPSLHLEVDKSRQILMVIKGGTVLGIIPVSTGATGNTPEGVFSIRQKHSWTTALYGSALLFRTMGFYMNFAIHGYPVVPPYPASHGCIREPMWVADWVYRQSHVGERLYIYH